MVFQKRKFRSEHEVQQRKKSKIQNMFEFVKTAATSWMLPWTLNSHHNVVEQGMHFPEQRPNPVENGVDHPKLKANAVEQGTNSTCAEQQGINSAHSAEAGKDSSEQGVNSLKKDVMNSGTNSLEQGLSLSNVKQSKDGLEILPDELLDSVLCRLEMPTLLAVASCVCKSWRDKLASPSFRQLVNSASSSNKWLLVNAVSDTDAHEPVLLLFDTSSSKWHRRKLEGVSCNGFVREACNGAVLLNRMDRRIGNPLTNEWIKLPVDNDGWSSLLPKPGGRGYQLLSFSPDDTGHKLLGSLWDSSMSSWKLITTSPAWHEAWYFGMSSYVVDIVARIFYGLKAYYRGGFFYKFDIDLNKWEQYSLAFPQSLEVMDNDRRAPAVVILRGQPFLVGLVKRSGRAIKCDCNRCPVSRMLRYPLCVGIFSLPNLSLKAKAPAELVKRCAASVRYSRFYTAQFNFTTDQRDNLWCVLPYSNFILHYNMTVDRWSLLQGPPTQGLLYSVDTINKPNLFCNLSLSAIK